MYARQIDRSLSSLDVIILKHTKISFLDLSAALHATMHKLLSYKLLLLYKLLLQSEQNNTAQVINMVFLALVIFVRKLKKLY